MRNGVDFRRTRPEAATIFDMHFAELAHDPLAMVKRIYAHFDLPLSAVAEARMRDFIEHNPKERHGVHRYTLQEFGLDPERERERYRFYQDYFGVANEG